MAGIRGQRSGGRNKKPTAAHVIAGTFRKDRHADQDVTPPAGAPRLPKGLDGAALAVWHELAAYMEASGTLSSVDAAALENHCRLAALVMRIEAGVAALPSLTFDHAVGGGLTEPKAHPLIAQLRAGRMALRASLQEFGLTPASRTRVTKPAAPVADPLAKFTGRTGA